MHKIIVFDLDGTLAPVGKGTPFEEVLLLRQLEERGYMIAVCSGKPSYYLCGYMRQIGLREPVLLGENGGTVQFGVDLPPERYYEMKYSEKARQQLRAIKARINETCPEMVWYQPNEIEVTPFFKDMRAADIIQELIDEDPDALSEVDVYRFFDCYDFVPKGISKGNGLKFLSELTGVSREGFIAVGDGINDVPMFEYADVSIAIGDKVTYKTDYRFESIGEALKWMDVNPI